MGSHTNHAVGHTPEVHGEPDAWHRHTSAEGAPQAEHGSIASASSIARWYVGIVVTVAVTVLILMMYFGNFTHAFRAQRVERDAAAAMSQEAVTYKAKMAQELESAVPLDGGKVRLPIGVAKEKVVKAYAK